jgi:hypothetical protein
MVRGELGVPAMSNVIGFPKSGDDAPELLIGPFSENRVVVDGRVIPLLSGYRAGDETVLVLDHRFSVGVPHEYAYPVAWLLANALAIGQGYASMNATSKDKPFAPQCSAIAIGDIAP